jgi:DNA-binding CsgD family transcriptional regulator
MSSPKSKESRSLDILQGIKTGTTNPALLSPKQRRRLVILLIAEGQSTAEIAHILKVSDRTIERDKQKIRKKNAIVKDPKLAEQMAGRLLFEAETAIQKIRKYERDKQTSPATRIDAEHKCFQIVNELAERLQSMGYLPTATKKLEADLKHHLEETLSLDQISSEAQRLQDIKSSLPIKKIKKVKSRTLKKKGKKNE